MKICATCCRKKPLDQYTADPKSADGVRYSCKRCVTDAQMFRKYELSKDPVLKTLFDRTARDHQNELKFMRSLPPQALADRNRRVAELAARVQIEESSYE